jgi:hypothetical protein
MSFETSKSMEEGVSSFGSSEHSSEIESHTSGEGPSCVHSNQKCEIYASCCKRYFACRFDLFAKSAKRGLLTSKGSAMTQRITPSNSVFAFGLRAFAANFA